MSVSDTRKHRVRGRRLARESALRTLFQLESSGGTVEDAFLYNAHEMSLEPVQREFGLQLALGTWTHLQSIDEIIGEIAHKWAVSRIARTDLAVLRLAVYEIVFQKSDDVPASVAVNEAVELAKAYGNDDSGRFINGILGQIIRNLD